MLALRSILLCQLVYAVLCQYNLLIYYPGNECVQLGVCGVCCECESRRFSFPTVRRNRSRLVCVVCRQRLACGVGFYHGHWIDLRADLAGPFAERASHFMILRTRRTETCVHVCVCVNDENNAALSFLS